MIIGGERVHRIVAYAFLGEPPTPQHVVDHIDTNRRNNRPQNLRWLTKLENVLLNPITRKRIEFLCGSIEAFINDPSIIQEFANDNPNFAWMRTVSAEEAKASYERLKLWAETPSAPTSTSNGTMGEWIYASTKRHEHIEPFSKYSSVPSNQSEFSAVEYKQDILTESLSPTAMQSIGVHRQNFRYAQFVGMKNHWKHIPRCLKKGLSLPRMNIPLIILTISP